MRKRDLHILTSNIYTYTGDQRFSVIHAPDSEDWDLKIEYPQKKDEGIYECQVNTEPKINLAVLLHVTGTKCLDLVFCTHNHRIVRWLALSPFDVTHGTVVNLQDNVSDQTNSVLFGAPTTRRRNVQFDSQREPQQPLKCHIYTYLFISHVFAGTLYHNWQGTHVDGAMASHPIWDKVITF